MRLWIIVMALAFLALIPAFVAEAKGRSFRLFWVYGFCFLPIALLHASVVGPVAKASASASKSNPTDRYSPRLRMDGTVRGTRSAWFDHDIGLTDDVVAARPHATVAGSIRKSSLRAA